MCFKFPIAKFNNRFYIRLCIRQLGSEDISENISRSPGHDFVLFLCSRKIWFVIFPWKLFFSSLYPPVPLLYGFVNTVSSTQDTFPSSLHLVLSYRSSNISLFVKCHLFMKASPDLPEQSASVYSTYQSGICGAGSMSSFHTVSLVLGTTMNICWIKEWMWGICTIIRGAIAVEILELSDAKIQKRLIWEFWLYCD